MDVDTQVMPEKNSGIFCLSDGFMMAGAERVMTPRPASGAWPLRVGTATRERAVPWGSMTGSACCSEAGLCTYKLVGVGVPFIVCPDTDDDHQEGRRHGEQCRVVVGAHDVPAA